MSLEARVGLVLGALELDVELSVGPSEVVALLGPNGAGKTTLLRSLAGLEALDRGRVVLDGEVLEDPAARVYVPTERRAVGYVFQDHLLFPHLSALDNVAFGLRCRGVAKPEARRRALGWLERLGLAAHAGARPRALSGGQAQRVALARALAPSPRLLLLDEPLSALDASARSSVRSDLRRHLRSFAGARLLVTHDPGEAMMLADRLVVLEDGRVVQAGSPTDISRNPRSPWIAQLVGLNLFRGRARAGVVELSEGGPVVTAEPHLDGDAFVTFAPQAVALFTHRPQGSARNLWEATVRSLEAAGDQVLVRVDGGIPLVARVTPSAVDELGLAEGLGVWVAVKATDVTAYEA